MNLIIVLDGNILWIKICGLNLVGNGTSVLGVEEGSHEALTMLKPNN